MTLYHHDSRTYDVAASAAATRARTMLEEKIQKGRASAASAYDRIMSEVPNDMIVSAGRLRFLPNELDDPRPVKWDLIESRDSAVEGLLNPLDLHNHALVQVGSRGGFAKAYLNTLEKVREPWARDLVAHNLNQLYSHMPQNRRFLVRTVDNETRGFLSDSFRRLDSRPIVEQFVGECAKVGAVPVDGHYMGTKVALKALYPAVFEPVENEVLAYGVQISNSDFGDGALTVQSFVLRLWCTNYAIAEDALRQVHLGKKLGDNIKFSEKTYALDTATTVSAVEDIMKTLLSHRAVDQVLGAVKKANEEGVTAYEVGNFLKHHLNNEDAKTITEKFASADIELLPPGQTKWRLSNALSWFAGEQEDERKRIELQELAGKAMKLAAA